MGRPLEVLRTCTEGTRNADSALYGAAWRASKAIGACRAITDTQHGQSGASPRAAGWRLTAIRRPAGGWNRPSRPRRAPRYPIGVRRALWLVGHDFEDRRSDRGSR